MYVYITIYLCECMFVCWNLPERSLLLSRHFLLQMMYMFLQLWAIKCVCVLIWKNVVFICFQDFSAPLEKEILSSGNKLYLYSITNG